MPMAEPGGHGVGDGGGGLGHDHGPAERQAGGDGHPHERVGAQVPAGDHGQAGQLAPGHRRDGRPHVGQGDVLEQVVEDGGDQHAATRATRRVDLGRRGRRPGGRRLGRLLAHLPLLRPPRHRPKHLPVIRSGKRAGYREPAGVVPVRSPGSNTGQVLGATGRVASVHGALDASGPAAAGAAVPLGSAVQPGRRHHRDRAVRPVHGQGHPGADPDRAVHRRQPRPGGAPAGQAGHAPRGRGHPDLRARLRPGRRVPDLGDPAAGDPVPQPGRRPARLPEPPAGPLVAVPRARRPLQHLRPAPGAGRHPAEPARERPARLHRPGRSGRCSTASPSWCSPSTSWPTCRGSGPGWSGCSRWTAARGPGGSSTWWSTRSAAT